MQWIEVNLTIFVLQAFFIIRENEMGINWIRKPDFMF